MFERMIMQTSITTDLVATPTSAVATTTEINLRSVWRPIINEPDEADRSPCPDNDITDECQLLKACTNQLSALRAHDKRKPCACDKNKSFDVRPVFYAGILIGTVIGGCVMYGLMLLRECCRSKSQHRLRRTYVIRGQRGEYWV